MAVLFSFLGVVLAEGGADVPLVVSLVVLLSAIGFVGGPCVWAPIVDIIIRVFGEEYRM